MKYTVQMVEEWGVYVDLQHVAPGDAYNNTFTDATDLLGLFPFYFSAILTYQVVLFAGMIHGKETTDSQLFLA